MSKHATGCSKRHPCMSSEICLSSLILIRLISVVYSDLQKICFLKWFESFSAASCSVLSALRSGAAGWSIIFGPSLHVSIFPVVYYFSRKLSWTCCLLLYLCHTQAHTSTHTLVVWMHCSVACKNKIVISSLLDHYSLIDYGLTARS